MKVIYGIQPSRFTSSVVTLGMFDGVHRGHQALLSACRAHASALGLPAVALTYHPHPSQILRPEHPVRQLTPLSEKLERLAQHRMDCTVVAQFTPEFSLISADAFLQDVLVDALHPRVVVAGYRTTFGHGRVGTADGLRAQGCTLGFATDIVEPIEVAGGPVSSTRIRQALENGEAALAAELLGYPYRLLGTVEHGDARGRTLGFPTANLAIPAEKMLPREGVYAVRACGDGLRHIGVMNIGPRPTFDRPLTVEVHLLDFHGDLYGRSLAVDCLAFIRETRAFAGPDALTAQIHRDIACARELTS